MWLDDVWLCPFYEYSYGSTPTAGAMALAYFDHQQGYGKFIDYHVTRWDPIQLAYDHHVPSIQAELARIMDTNSNGVTSWGDAEDGFTEIIDRLYNGECWAYWDETVTTENGMWQLCAAGIDYQSEPRVIAVETAGPDYSMTVVGFQGDPNWVYAQDGLITDCRAIPESLLNTVFVLGVVVDNPVFTEIVSPNGDSGWEFPNGNTETFYIGQVHPITWISNMQIGDTYAKLYYNDDGGATDRWFPITSNTPNDGVYEWLVPPLNGCPHGSSTNYARIKIELYLTASNTLIAADGSFGNFNIHVGGNGIPALGMAGADSNINPNFYTIDFVEDDIWGVVGVRDNRAQNADYWGVYLYNDATFTGLAKSSLASAVSDFTNYIVINNHQQAPKEWGVKFSSPGFSPSSRVQFHNDPEATLSLGTNANLAWGANDVVKMFNVYLSPVQHMFQMDVMGTSADLDFAIFASDGNGLFSLLEAKASSRTNANGGSESFNYYVPTAGWYGICVSSRTAASCTYSISITESGKWIGGVSSNWHTAANWLGNVVPNFTYDIIIPGGCAFYPVISQGDADPGRTKSLTIASGASVTVNNGTLDVFNNLRVFGSLVLNHANSVVNVDGNVIWEAGSVAVVLNASATISCAKHWTFKPASSAGFDLGTVVFNGNTNSIIQSDSEGSYFKNFRVSKAAGVGVVISEISQANLVIKGSFRVDAGAIFTSDSWITVETQGLFYNYGNLHFNAGTLKFSGIYTTFQFQTGDYFNNIEMNRSVPTTLVEDLHLNGDLIISSGILAASEYDIYLGGSWINNVGSGAFFKGTGTVFFIGSGTKTCNGENFYKLEIANANCTLSFTTGVSSCDFYEWTAGTLSMDGGTLTINDLMDNGLYGHYTVNSGELHITQNSTQKTDLNGEVIIHGGEMTVTGGSGTSYWAWAANARLEMSGGLLDFTNRGIRIQNSGYSLITDITGGAIRTGGSFNCLRTDFRPEGGILEMYGAGDDVLYVDSQSYIRNLVINKASSRESELENYIPDESVPANQEVRTNTVSLTNSLSIPGNVLILSGSLVLNGKSLVVEDAMEVSGNLKMTNAADYLSVRKTLKWKSGATATITTGTIDLYSHLTIYTGSSFVLGAGNTISFIGDTSTQISNNVAGSTFGNMWANKVSSTNKSLTFSGTQPLSILGDLTVLEGTNLVVWTGVVTVNGGVTAQEGTNINVYTGGKLTVGANFDSSGDLLIDDGEFNCHNGFTLAGTSSLSILGTGKCVLDKAFSSTLFSLACDVTIAETGLLEVTNNGLQLSSSTSIAMTGGTIKVGWDFKALNNGIFWFDGGSVEFIGARTSAIQTGTGNYFKSLVFNKPSTAYAVNFLSNITIGNDLIVQGGNPNLSGHTVYVGRDVLINGGKLSAASSSDQLKVGRNWANNAGSTAFEEGSGTVYFDYINELYSGVVNTDTFNNVILAKGTGSYLYLEANNTMTVKGNLSNPGSNFTIREGSVLKINNGSAFSLGSSGAFSALGTAVNPAKLTSDNGYYSFNTVSGSAVSAQHCIFEKMDANGINISSGAVVNSSPLYSFYACTFQNGAAGGTLFKKSSTQEVNISNAVFPTNTWSGAYNVYHSPTAGSITFNNASGGFYGQTYENDPGNRIHWVNESPNPTVAHSPLPANNATDVLTSTMLSWEYTSTPNFADPIGYIVKLGTDPMLNVCLEGYTVGGPGTHNMQPAQALQEGTTYYWQVIPTTEVERRNGEQGITSNNSGRGAAIDCPIWSFTTAGGAVTISVFPYEANFETGAASWTSGAISGANHWQLGTPTVAPMNSAHSGINAWATYLSQNYADGANTWLMSPALNFTDVSAPNFSVWLHLNCEINWDAMILESSINGGGTWQKVVGNAGFYNNTSTSGPIAPNKWSGQIGTWAQYSTALTGLANQSLVYLRFRFGSDGSYNYQGMAVDDVRIWDANAVPTFAWAEDFTGITTGTLPAGWESTHPNWSVQSSSYSGGAVPEMVFNYSPYSTNNFYLKSPELNTTGYTQLALSFKQFTSHYTTPYTLKLISIVGATEYLIQEWVNPTGNIAAGTVTNTLTAAGHGVGASNLRLAWIFSGYSYNINYWYLDDISLVSQAPYPALAHTPVPANGATLVPVTTGLGWIYTTNAQHPDPVGYKLRLGTSPTMAVFMETYTSGGPGTYLVNPSIGLAPETTYYWQVIPSTDARSNTLSAASAQQRSDTINCPIWSFTTAAEEQVTSFPYTEDFESGSSSWYSGAVTGNDHWQIGDPAQTYLNSAHSGTNTWMTYLAANYENNANTWLKSPPLNFSSLSNPKLSVWLNVWCESNWDGMILESSIDGGSSWQYVSGEAGFYNPGEPYGPLPVSKWNGFNGAWVQYTTALSGLASQSQVYLRFRFASDDSSVYEGIAMDDIHIWNEEILPAVAHTPIPAHNAADVSINTGLGWSYTSSPLHTDPVSYIVKGGTDPLLNTCDLTYVSGGPGTYSIPMFFDISYGGTYYWQVIPTTDTYSRQAQLGIANERSSGFRSDAANCPIWSFTIENPPVPISVFPYNEDFESGMGEWNSGAISGANHWQLGTPAQDNISTAHSGTNAWMTYLSQNYANNANTWLLSPMFDFSGLSNPMFSVWINQWSETNYDAMILESSIDGGVSWQYVSGSAGFYNSSVPYGPITVPKWSGKTGTWNQYSTALSSLAYQSPVFLRFRFVSDDSMVFEGMAVDDISIWNTVVPIFAVSPTSKDFGTVQTGYSSAAQEFQISNLGSGTITMAPSDIQLMGANAGDFSLTNIPGTVNLEAGQSVVVSVQFTPLSEGDKTASLQIEDNIGVVRNLGINRVSQSKAIRTDRDLHQVPLAGTSIAPPVYDLPLSEDFSRAGINLLPEDWSVTHANWNVQTTEEAGGTMPEIVFSSAPLNEGVMYFVSPRINTSDLNQLALSFKHRLVHSGGNYTLKVVAMVGTTEYTIQQWINPPASIAAETLLITLSSANHGVGAPDLRIAWIFSGNSANINTWHIDDINLEGIAPTVVTGNATDITSQSAILHAAITNAGSSAVTAKGFYYGTLPNPFVTGTRVISDSPGNDFNAIIGGLTSEVEVFYCGFATNSQGTAYGDELSFITLGQALAAPENLSITIMAGSAVLNWDAVPGANSYKVYRCLDPLALDWGIPVAITSNHAWTDTSVSTQYFYRVTASSEPLGSK